MADKFLGRANELKIIHSFLSGAQQIALIYGRRRIGKTKLIEKSLQGRPSIFFEGLENEPQQAQIYNFIFQLERQAGFQIPNKSRVKTWSEALILLSDFLRNNSGAVIVLDELQWMANGRSRMISELKMVWERYLSKFQGAKLILSGSIASFMIKKVLKSKALYGRIDTLIHLKPLPIEEVREFFAGTDPQNALLAYLFVGGVPKYLELLSAHQSALRGVAYECFADSGYLKAEFERIFVSHFGKSSNYQRIISALKGRYFGLSRGELDEMQVSKGGGQLSQELYNLEEAGFITCFVPFDKDENSKFKRYVLSDPFLSFYLNFMQGGSGLKGDSPDSFISSTFMSPALHNWLGHSLELLALLHKDRIAQLLGFGGIKYSAGPYFRHSKGGQIKGVQLDLVFDRADHIVTVCEIKYLKSAVPVSVGRELAQKIDQVDEFAGRTIQRVIISNQAGSADLLASGLVGRVIRVDEF